MSNFQFKTDHTHAETSLGSILCRWDPTQLAQQCRASVEKRYMTYVSNMVRNPLSIQVFRAHKIPDIIICEDDPYSFLQYPSYVNGSVEETEKNTKPDFLSSLAPSFLKYDTQGRVIRLDTFSKTLAPGCRLGYFVVNPLFWERLLRATEVETQAPSGWSQSIIYTLLHKWGIDGYLQWLQTLKDQYQARRNWICDAFAANFDIQSADITKVPSSEGLVAYSRGKSIPVFSFVPPTGGMFIWARFYFSQCPRFIELQKQKDIEDPEQTFADEIWAKMADSLVSPDNISGREKFGC